MANPGFLKTVPADVSTIRGNWSWECMAGMKPWRSRCWLFFFFLGKGTNSQRSQAALRDFPYFRNQRWSRRFLKKKKFGFWKCSLSALPLWWWSCGRPQWQCGGVRKAVKPEILLLVLGSAWNILEKLWMEQRSQSGHGKSLRFHCSKTFRWKGIFYWFHVEFIACVKAKQPLLASSLNISAFLGWDWHTSAVFSCPVWPWVSHFTILSLKFRISGIRRTRG